MQPGRIQIWMAQLGPPQQFGGAAMPLLVFTLLLLMAIGVALFFWFRWRRVRPLGSAESMCGHCGYLVTGLPTFVCPECGSDLREVGIIKGGKPALMQPKISLRTWGKLLGWTFVVGIVFLLFGASSFDSSAFDAVGKSADYGFIDAYLWPYAGNDHDSLSMKPKSRAYRQLTIREDREATFFGWRNTPRIGRGVSAPVSKLTRFGISLQLVDASGKVGSVTIDASKNLAWSSIDSAGGSHSGGGPIDSAAIQQWIIGCGADVFNAKGEADEILGIIRRAADPNFEDGQNWAGWRLEKLAGGSPVSGTAGFHLLQATPAKSFAPLFQIEWVTVPFTALLWVGGVQRIIRRAKKTSADTGAMASKGESQPAKDGQSRTLTILFTDMKDFTARTAAASRESLLKMLRVNKLVVESAVRTRGGTVVKTIGDACLVTFDSATDAVLAGLEIQAGADRHNAGAGNGDRLELRIGVSTGEVTSSNSDVFGTAVNVAARVQSLAEAGEVYFTESTWHAMNAAEVPNTDLGVRELKGIAVPVRVFRANRSG